MHLVILNDEDLCQNSVTIIEVLVHGWGISLSLSCSRFITLIECVQSSTSLQNLSITLQVTVSLLVVSDYVLLFLHISDNVACELFV